MNNNRKITASGFIVFRNNNNHPELLGLIALSKHRKRSKGKYDLPKGRIDEGETALQAAYRECFEESGLEQIKIIDNDPLTNGPLALWVGEVSIDDEVRLEENPYTGELEHEGYEWISIKDMKKQCLNYLRPFIVKAEPIIWNHFRIWNER